MHISLDSFEVITDGTVEEEYPKKIQEVIIKYIFKGKELRSDKIKKAVHLSMEKYCGVYATLQPGVKMTYQIIINGEIEETS